MRKLNNDPEAALEEFEKEAHDSQVLQDGSQSKNSRANERRGRKKKDPDMPKRSLSTFIYFSQDVSFNYLRFESECAVSTQP